MDNFQDSISKNSQEDVSTNLLTSSLETWNDPLTSFFSSTTQSSLPLTETMTPTMLPYPSPLSIDPASSSLVSSSLDNGLNNKESNFLTMCSNWNKDYNESSEDLQRNLLMFQTFMDKLTNFDPDPPFKYTIIIIFYALIVVVSSIGNIFVVWAIFSKKRTRTTVNIFIANLACSDLLMTIFNIPFNVARLLMSQWIFGQFLCHVVPFIQVTSVYVSTLTMAFIAIDRFQAILRPMKPKISSQVGSCVAIIAIWMTSCFFSLPFLLFNRVVVMNNHVRSLTRCRVSYPDPVDLYKKSINIATFILQFAIPLTIMVCLYTKIGIKIWPRVTIGATTREQELRQLVVKRKTIVMLLLVAVVFAICWLPLNLYHLLVDFTDLKDDFNTFIVFNWFAMSSVCYNPFIYFWLNRRRLNRY